jgi:hypothetical protein
VTIAIGNDGRGRLNNGAASGALHDHLLGYRLLFGGSGWHCGCGKHSGKQGN